MVIHELQLLACSFFFSTSQLESLIYAKMELLRFKKEMR